MDLETEKTQLIREQRLKVARENRVGDREYAPIAVVERVWSSVTIEYRQRVLNADIPRQLKDELLEILTEPKIDEYFSTALAALPAGSSDSSDGTD